MTATDRLLRLLVPLGAYSFESGTYSLGEIMAFGSEADIAKAYMEGIEKDCCLLTASDEGLKAFARLFGFTLPSDNTDSLRRAVIGLLNISGDGFTPAAINAAIADCGMNAVVTAKEDGGLMVMFPGVMGEPERFELMRPVIENILPAHLEPEYVFVYLTWLQAGSITWQQAAEYTWYELGMMEMTA